MNALRRSRSFRIVFITCLILLSFSLVSAQEGRLGGGTPVSIGNSFLHSTEPSNNVDNWTLIHSPLTDSNPNAVVFYTHNWNPDGDPSGTNSVPYPQGVWYEGSGWSLFNQDYTIPYVANTYFNIMAQGLGGNVFIHTSDAANISSDATRFDNVLTNGNPDAIIFVAPNWNASSVYHNHSLGVYYDPGIERWMIFNEDMSAMQSDVAFNVIVKAADDTTFVHTKTTGDNTYSESYSPLNNLYLNNNPYAQIIVTQQYGEYNNSEVGVWYDESLGQWYVYNESGYDMPDGTKFNIHIASYDWDNHNLLINSGFEVPGESASQPVNWVTQDKAKRKCSNLAAGKDVSFASECAMAMKGKPGFNTQIKQAGAVSSTSTSAWFHGHFTGKNVFGGLKATAKLTLSNGTDYKLALDSSLLNSGTYELEVEETSILPATAVAYNVKVKMIAPVGKVLIDEMGLYVNAVARSTETVAEVQPLPLPGLSVAPAGMGGPRAGQAAIAQALIAKAPGQ
jgi:hypothetical protein